MHVSMLLARLSVDVGIEDVFEVEDVFSMLMGELVAPRKSFIAAHARSVKNLDV